MAGKNSSNKSGGHVVGSAVTGIGSKIRARDSKINMSVASAPRTPPPIRKNTSK